MTALPTLKLRAVAQFPVTVAGSGGVSVTKSNGEWAVSPSFSDLDETTSITDSGNIFTWVYNSASDKYGKIALDTLITELALTGAGIAFPVTVDTDTTDSDPGAGRIKFDNSTQNSATTFYVNLQDARGVDITNALDYLDNSTNPAKGQISLTKIGDSSKTAIFEITAVTSASGYRKLTVSNIASSSSSPFANGDAVLFQFTLSGNDSVGDVTSTSGFGVDNVIIRADGTAKALQASGVVIDDSNNVTGVAAITTSGTGTFVKDDSTNNGVTRPVVARHTTSGTPAAGIGSGLQFEVETASGDNVEIAGAVDVVASSVSAGAENFDLVVKLQAAGGAVDEKFRVTYDGIASVAGAYTLISSNGGVNMTGGISETSYNAGTYSGGTFTPNPLLGNIQHYTNNGAHTLAPPSSVSPMIIQVLNGASAGTITTSGFTKVNGDALNTTAGKAFELAIRKLNSYSLLTITAIN